MEEIRKPFQGILNILRFNWHFYAIGFVIISLFLIIAPYTNPTISKFIHFIIFLMVLTVFISLVVSYYVYDLSGFYELNWIKNNDNPISVLNINAGFDETSVLLKTKFKNATFLVLDFYNPKKHTEISIKRARKIYPPNSKTINISTSKIDLQNNSVDKIFIILSAHEIRNQEERINFFKELNRIIKPKGQIFVTEHLRGFSNFFAYNIGAFHFFSRSNWLNTFDNAKLNVVSEIKKTPFISTFILEPNGNTL